MFKVNEGNTDRIIRAILGLVLIVLALTSSGLLQIVLLLGGAVVLFTAATGFCALYAVFGISTCPAQKSTN